MDTRYWVTMTMSRMSKVVMRTVRDAGIQLHGELGFTVWDEFKQYCTKRYVRPQHALNATRSAIYGLKQTGSLEAYIGLLDAKLALCPDSLPLIFKKTILLNNMRPAVKERLMVQPTLLNAEYATFCVQACLIDDSMFRERAPTKAHT